MSGINKVILVGRLGTDPEVKAVGDSSVCNFSMATSESWKDKEGNKQEKTEWHKIAVWGKLADVCERYLSKGKQVYLEGSLHTRSWETDTGEKRYSTEIKGTKVEFLGGGEAREESPAALQSDKKRDVPNHADNIQF